MMALISLTGDWSPPLSPESELNFLVFPRFVWLTMLRPIYCVSLHCPSTWRHNCCLLATLAVVVMVELHYAQLNCTHAKSPSSLLVPLTYRRMRCSSLEPHWSSRSSQIDAKRKSKLNVMNQAVKHSTRHWFTNVLELTRLVSVIQLHILMDIN